MSDPPPRDLGVHVVRHPHRAASKFDAFLERNGLAHVGLYLGVHDAEFVRESKRLGVSRSALLWNAWVRARDRIRALPSVPPIDDPSSSRRR